ncbi:MAG: hypothetical protein HOW73_29890 [Polyangiaceae bacterium]|nr:hypothetical protein [Polyangiaceae bacterium]
MIRPVVVGIALTLLVSCGDSRAPADPSSSAATTQSAASSKPPWIVEAKPPAAVLPHSLTVGITKDGFVVKRGREEAGPPCTGVKDTKALTTCARAVKKSAPDETQVVVWAEPTIQYRLVIETLDALRKDDAGDLFPEFQFAFAASTSNAMVPSSAAPIASESPAPSVADTALPIMPAPTASKGDVTSEPGEEGVIIRISKTQITMGDEARPVVEYQPGSIGAEGLPASVKRNGQNDLYIVPISQALVVYRVNDKRIRELTGKDPSTSDAIIVADETTPYRLLMEVLFTAGQCEFGRYHLLLRTK